MVTTWAAQHSRRWPNMHKAIKDTIIMSASGDDWGDTMEGLFSVATALHFRGENVPPILNFRPGLGLTETTYRSESFTTDMLLTDLDSGAITADDLRHAA